MEKLVGEHEGQSNISISRVALAAGIGTAVEWYDFFLYGTTAALVFGPLFFPNFSPLAGTLAAFGTFGVGFISRPIGGIIFGHYGDRIGRKAMLVLTLLIMGVATFIIGLLPTYAAIGIWAPILLIVMRILQGFGMGGELGGAQLMCVEYSPDNRRGFYGCWPMMGAPIGQILATGMLAALALTLSEQQFLAWGWRVPFILSIILVGVGLFIRLKILETPAFRRVQETRTEANIPIVDVLRLYPGKVMLAIGMYLGITVSFYATTVFVISYATNQLGVSFYPALLMVLIAMAVVFPLIGVSGAISDRVGRRTVYCAGGLLMMVAAFPFFFLLDTKIFPLMVIGVVLLATAFGTMGGAQGSYFAELFGTRVRYSGVSLGVTMATLIGGAVTPPLGTVLIAWADGSTWPVSLYFIGIGLIATLSAYIAGETFRNDIYEVYAQERQLIAEANETVPEGKQAAQG